MFDAVKVKNDIVQWIREWFAHNGHGCNAVIGISGGKDSTVVAALCVEALGKNRVLGVKLPCGVQSDIKDANRLIDFLGIESYEIGDNYITVYFFFQAESLVFVTKNETFP